MGTEDFPSLQGLTYIGGGFAIGPLNQAGEGELGRAIHSDEEVEFALGGAHSGLINGEVADGIGTELPLFHAQGVCSQIG